MDAADSGFGTTVTIPDVDDWEKMTLLGFEREMLGLYVSDHPLFGLEHVLSNGTDATIGALLTDEDDPAAQKYPHGSVVTVAGLVTGVNRKITKRGDPWATLTLEDLEGSVEVLLFPSAYQLAATHLAEDAILRIKVRVDRERDSLQLNGMEVTVPDLGVGAGATGPVTISMPSTRCTPQTVAELKNVLAAHAGMTEVRLRLLTRESVRVLKLDDRLRVTPSSALFADLKHLLGPGCLSG
jgi:DNA polymerase-3 subunit alpha